MAEGPKEFQIDGEPYTTDDLTFKETHEVRRLAKELSEDENFDMALADAVDWWPAMIFVIRRRSNPKYTLDDALNTRAADYLVEKRPTKRAAPVK